MPAIRLPDTAAARLATLSLITTLADPAVKLCMPSSCRAWAILIGQVPLFSVIEVIWLAIGPRALTTPSNAVGVSCTVGGKVPLLKREPSWANCAAWVALTAESPQAFAVSTTELACNSSDQASGVMPEVLCSGGAAVA